MQAFVPKNRRPKFDLKLKIIDLNNVPLVTGKSYVKWHLPSSSSAEHRGRTSKSAIRDHRVSWEYEKTLPVRLVIDKHGTLQESEIHLEVLQEYSSGARGESIVLGNVRLNLAEYVESSDEGDDGVTRRYLMQESKINSTLKVGIFMNQVEGDTNFSAPVLRIAPVFGGIAGIVTGEQGEPDDVGHMPSISTKTREMSKLQDMYRQTLAASWAAQVGELPADKCIEEIFTGGDGWGGRGPRGNLGEANESMQDLNGNDSDGDRKTVRGHHRRSSPRYQPSLNTHTSHHHTNSREDSQAKSQSGINGRASIEQHVQSSSAESVMPDYLRTRSHEVDEFSAREDFKSWEVSAK